MSLKIKRKNFQVSVTVGHCNQAKIKLRKFNKPVVSKPSLGQKKNVLKRDSNFARAHRNHEPTG